jgi:hypothetical protein
VPLCNAGVRRARPGGPTPPRARCRKARRQSMGEIVKVVLFFLVILEFFGCLWLAAHPEKLYRKKR